MIVNIHNAAKYMFDSKLIEPNDNPNVIKGSTYIESNYDKLLKYSAVILNKYTNENIDIKKYDLLNSVYERIKSKEDDGWYADDDDGTERIVKDFIFKAAKSALYHTQKDLDISELDIEEKDTKDIDRLHQIDEVIADIEAIIKSNIADGNKRLIITAIIEPEELLNNDAALYFLRKFNDEESRLLFRGLKSKSGIRLTEKERSKYKAWLI